MKGSKKGLTLAASILTIVSSVFACLLAIIAFVLSSFFDEELFKNSFLDDERYVYYETVDEDYYFQDISNDSEVYIYEDDIEMMGDIFSGIFKAVGVISLLVGVSKLILAIVILNKLGSNKFPFGCTVSLLIISILTMSLVESGLLIASLCIKDDKNINNQQTPNNIEIEKSTE